jgi:hypothetical protein
LVLIGKKHIKNGGMRIVYVGMMNVIVKKSKKWMNLMSENQELTVEQKRELNNILEVIQAEADIVKLDYEQNPSNLDSGSIIVVHQDSSLLNDIKEKLSDVAYNIQKKKK